MGAQSSAFDAAMAVAEKSKAAGGEERYFVAKAAGHIADQVRKLTKLGDATASPQMIILDIPDQGGSTCQRALVRRQWTRRRSPSSSPTTRRRSLSASSSAD